MPEIEQLKVDRKSKGTPAESNATERPPTEPAPVDPYDNPMYYRGIDWSEVKEVQFTEQISTPFGRRWRICLIESAEQLANIKLVPNPHGLEISCDWKKTGGRWTINYPWELGIISYTQRTGEA